MSYQAASSGRGVREVPGTLGPLLESLALSPPRQFRDSAEGRQSGKSCRFAREETCGAKVAPGQRWPWKRERRPPGPVSSCQDRGEPRIERPQEQVQGGCPSRPH